jgi:hypothetical protein
MPLMASVKVAAAEARRRVQMRGLASAALADAAR